MYQTSSMEKTEGVCSASGLVLLPSMKSFHSYSKFGVNML